MSAALRRKFKLARGFGPLASRTLASQTQEQAADTLGVSKRTWQDWERGVNQMPEYALRLYRHVVGLERIPFRSKGAA